MTATCWAGCTNFLSRFASAEGRGGGEFWLPPDQRAEAVDTVLQQAEQVCKDWAEQREALPFVRVTPGEGDRYRTCVPLLSLRAAAGAFGETQQVEPEAWVQIPTARRLREGLFVAQVVGKSMEPRIPDGAYCLFSSPVTGSRQGRVVLAQRHDLTDPESGGRYTVKTYESEKAYDDDGSWTHTTVRLRPANPQFAPIVLTELDGEAVRVVAEVLEVLEGGLRPA